MNQCSVFHQVEGSGNIWINYKDITMLNKAIVAIMVLVLTGCGIEEEPIDIYAHRYPWDGEYNLVTDLGFMVNHPWDFYTAEEAYDLGARIDNAWEETQHCTGVYIDPDRPMIIHYSGEFPLGVQGFVYWVPDYVYIRAVFYDPIDGSNLHTTRHEFVHYLLYLSGMSQTDNADHKTKLFDLCS